MQKAKDIISKIKEDKKYFESLPTGFKKLDEHLDGGFMKKELIVVGAFTGVGKSAVAGSLLYNIAKGGFLSAYYSLEISNAMVVSRLVGAIANVKPTRLMIGNLTPDEEKKRIKAESEIESLNEMMEFNDELYAFEAIKKSIIEGQFEFVVIDFIQNVIAPQQDEYSRLSFLALQFQKLAKETNCCILLLSQLSNAAAKRDDLEYKGSGSIATVCDLGFFIKRSDVTVGDKNQFILILRKNRRGFGNEWTFTYQSPGGLIEELK